MPCAIVPVINSDIPHVPLLGPWYGVSGTSQTLDIDFKLGGKTYAHADGYVYIESLFPFVKVFEISPFAIPSNKPMARV